VGGKQEWLAYGLPLEGEDAQMPRAGDRAARDVPTCSPSERVGVVRERVHAAGWDVCVVVNEQRVVLGLLRQRELEADAEARVDAVMGLGPSTFRPNVPIAEMQEYFQNHALVSAPITTPDGVLVGLLRQATE
jgi:Mg/Co/Ni transporter MgtE